MKRRTALIASITGVVALALVAILVIPGFTAESQGNPPQDKLAADGDTPACHLADMSDGQAMPASCGMADMAEDWDMDNMPEQCQQMMENHCMGSDGMMGMHHGMMSMHHNSGGMRGMMNRMNGTGEAGSEATHGMNADTDHMAGCPMTGRAADDNADATEKTVQ